MNDEIELTEMPAEAPQGGFRAAMASIKKIEKRFSLDGKASMGEYWVTFLLRWLPLALVSGGLMYAAGLIDLSALDTSDKKGISFLVTTGWLGIQILIPALFTLANLEMFPVTVRRLRDAKVCAGLAAFMIPAVVFFTAVAAVYPWLVCISALILLVPGILPSKAGADDANAAGVVTKTKMCYLAAVLFIISAAALGIATESLILRFGVEKMAKKYSKKNGDSSASTGSSERSLSESELKEMQMRGRKLIMGIIQANVERGPVWPRTYKEEGVSGDDVAGKAYTSAADYFNALFDMEHYGTPEWKPAVDRELLSTLGKNAVVNGKINPKGLDWCIAANVQEEKPDHTPVLISANVNPSNLRNDRALVVVRKSGAAELIKAPSYDTVYKGRYDDTSEHPIAWLTPTGVVEYGR